MIGVPTSTVLPSGTSSSDTTPAYGLGSSTSDLAVSISTITSLTATASPALTFQDTISASTNPSPTSGRLKICVFDMESPISVGERTVECLEQAVDVRQVLFLHLGQWVGHVEAADAQHRGLEAQDRKSTR